jgi:hypothetical protein
MDRQRIAIRNDWERFADSALADSPVNHQIIRPSAQTCETSKVRSITTALSGSLPMLSLNSFIFRLSKRNA